jgi:LysR family nitrogen assimilation transcriptional regulator
MDYKRFEFFAQVAQHGSFSKAASVIGIAQPALGRQVRKLEDECGTPLLYRHGRGVSLTPDGERLLATVKPLLTQIEGAVAELRADSLSPSGIVTLGLTPTLCRLIGRALVTQAQQRHPALRLNIVMAYSGYVHEWLTDARLDLAVVHDARRAPHMAVEHLGDLQLSLVSPADAVLAGRSAASVRLAQLQGVPLVLPTRHHGLRRTMELAAGQAGVTLDVAYEMDALELMLDLVRSGLAHTVLAAPVAAELVREGTARVRRIVGPGVVTRMMLAQATNRPSTRATRAVEVLLKQLVAEAAVLT